MKKTLFSSLLSLSAGIFLLTAAAQADVLKIKPSHPDRYTVVKGDTLWDISGRFLEHPWQWPEIWQINPQIEDPNWIYPGDVVELVYINGKPQLRKASGRVVLTPQMRIRDVAEPVRVIPINAINPVLESGYVVDSVGLAMVYKTFDQVSYALVMESHRGIQIGDHLRQP